MNLRIFKIVLLALFLSVFDLTVSAQTNEIDSLMSVVESISKDDGAKLFDPNLALAFAHLAIGDDSIALRFSKNAHNISLQIGDSAKIVKSGRLTAQIYNVLNQLDSSFAMHQSMLPIAKRHAYWDDCAKILNGIGIYYTVMGTYDKALIHFFESLELKEKFGSQNSLGSSFSNIGWVYYKLNDRAVAQDYFQKALKLQEPVNDTVALEILFENIALCYSKEGKFSESRRYLSKLKKICETGCDQLHYEVTLAFHYFYGDSLREAEPHFVNGYRLAKQQRNLRLLLDCGIQLSKICLRSGRIDEALFYINEVEKYRSAPHKKELVDLYQQLAKVYEAKKDYKHVALYQEKYIQLKDSVYGDEKRNNVMRVNAEFLERDNKAKIESQATALDIQSQLIERQKEVRLLIVIISALLFALVLILLVTNRRRKNSNKLLDLQVEEFTLELETSYRRLKASCEQQDAERQKLLLEIRSSMASVKGLCAVASMEISEVNVRNKLSLIEDASEHCFDNVREKRKPL